MNAEYTNLPDQDEFMTLGKALEQAQQLAEIRQHQTYPNSINLRPMNCFHYGVNAQLNNQDTPPAYLTILQQQEWRKGHKWAITATPHELRPYADANGPFYNKHPVVPNTPVYQTPTNSERSAHTVMDSDQTTDGIAISNQESAPAPNATEQGSCQPTQPNISES